MSRLSRIALLDSTEKKIKTITVIINFIVIQSFVMHSLSGNIYSSQIPYISKGLSSVGALWALGINELLEYHPRILLEIGAKITNLLFQLFADIYYPLFLQDAKKDLLVLLHSGDGTCVPLLEES